MLEYGPIHLHTVYSEQDAMSKPTDYGAFIQEYNKNATKYIITGMAVTEHGNMISATKHHLVAEKFGYKALFGCEVYHNLDDRDIDESKFHMVLIAKNQEGLKNLFTIVSDAGLHKLKGKQKDFPRTYHGVMAKHGKGIIATSACLGSHLSSVVMSGDTAKAEEVAKYYASMFEEFYLEVQPHDIPEQLYLNQELVKISQNTGIPLVITSDAHYILESDKEYHDILKTIAHQQPYSVSSHFRTPEELEEFCIKHGIPLDAITNCGEIVKKCNAKIGLDDPLGMYPDFPCPVGYNEETYLRKIANDGLRDFLMTQNIKHPKKYLDRLLYELNIICSMGFAGYFLILWDWILYCRNNNILIGKGRGSAAGSLVCRSLNITSVDPIKNGFIFERFMNPERIEPPDIDTDVSMAERPQAVQYFADKYGAEHVSQIITCSEYKIKSIFRNAMSALVAAFAATDADRKAVYEDVSKITKALPNLVGGNDLTYKVLKEVHDDPDNYPDESPEVINQCITGYNEMEKHFKKHPKVYMAVERLSGCISGTGTHAAGVIVSSKVIQDYIPVIEGKTAILNVIQCEMSEVGFYNALKIDALGLRTLTQIYRAMQYIGLGYDWYDSEDFSDPKVYEMLRDGHTTDIFQFGSSNATRMLKDMNVSSLDDLSVVNAGNRPGPLAKDKVTGKSMVDTFIERRKLKIKESIEPRIDAILDETEGCVWYQEQCQQLGQVMAGYSLGQADLVIRKTIGKKKMKEVPRIENEWLYGKSSEYDKDGNYIRMLDEPSKRCTGAVANGFTVEQGQKIFNTVSSFVKYSFNKAHSGCYSAIGYKTAWLSCYYPVEWSVACLTTYVENGNTNKMISTLSAARNRGAKILPPSINNLVDNFSIEHLQTGEKAIRFGLSGIKNVGDVALGVIKAVQDNMGRRFTSFDDYYDCLHGPQNQVKALFPMNKANPVNKTIESALIKAGAFDDFEPNRYFLLQHYHKTLRKDKDVPDYDPLAYGTNDKLVFEKEYMGLYVSEHPLEVYPYVDLSQCSMNEQVRTTGIIKSFKKQKKAKEFGKVFIETKDSKEIAVMLFGKIFDRFKSSMKKDEVIVVDGTYNSTYNNINASNITIISQNASPQQVSCIVDQRPDPMAMYV